MSNNFELEFKDDQAVTIATSPKNSYHQIIMYFDPKMCLMALLFKMLAVLFYFTFKLGFGLDISTFVVVVLMECFDFWVTKNLTGRMLVGLRWWSEFNDQGEEEWVFESCYPNRVISYANSNIFWASQFLIVLFWMVLVLINIITLSMFWTSLALFGFLLSTINLYCYFKCRGEHQKKIRGFAERMGLGFMAYSS